MVISFTGVLVLGIVSVLVPVVLALVPALPVPGAVLEVIAGIVIGPSVLGWVHIDVAITVLADLGLGTKNRHEQPIGATAVGFGLVEPPTAR